MADDTVQIAVRMRPMSDREIALNTPRCVTMAGKTCTVVNPEGGQEKMFSFNYVYDSFDENADTFATQEQVYNDVGKNLIQNAFKGYNCCIFAYGQTGSGKSHTMTGPPLAPNNNPEERGIIPRVMEEIFDRIAATTNDQCTYRVEVSFLEIYMENIRDLFNPAQGVPSLKVRESPTLGIYVEGLKWERVVSYKDVDQLMDLGNKIRTVAETNMNATSSRSHSVFTVNLTQTKIDRESMTASDITSKINLIDLAGSERQLKTGATGARLKEGSAINQSLSALGNVIEALADNATLKKTRLVPYRDSKLTRILQESLGGNSKTVMVATISPAAENYAETISTLRYASRASKIQNVAVINENPNERAIRELKAEVERLKALLEGRPDPTAQDATSSELAALRAELAKRDEYINELTMSRKDRESMLAAQMASRGQQLVGLQGDAGLSVDRRRAHFLNLSEDPAENESIVYYLKEDRNTLFGSDASQCDVVLKGAQILPAHCRIMCSEGTFTLTPAADGAPVFVRGVRVAEPVLLAHNDRVIIGTRHFFRFHDPVEAGLLDQEAVDKTGNEAETPGDIHDFHFALRELLANNPIDVDLADPSKAAELRGLEDLLLKLHRQTTEANAMVEAMGKAIHFRPNLRRDYSGGLANASQEVVVEAIRTDASQDRHLPPGALGHNSFLELFYRLKQAFVDFTEFKREPSADLISACIPPLIKVGVAHVLLLGVVDGVPVEQLTTPLMNNRGKELGLVKVSIEPATPEGKATSQIPDTWGELGSRMDLLVTVHGLSGLARPIEDVFCRFVLGGVSYSTPACSGKSANPSFSTGVPVTIKALDSASITMLEEGDLVIEVFGKNPAL